MVTTCDVCGGKYKRTISTALDTSYDFCEEHLQTLDTIIRNFIRFPNDERLWKKILEE